MTSVLLFACLIGLALLYRLPALMNPHWVNSDAAVVGIQGRHILSGEWDSHLWGAGYQSSFETILAAGMFWLFGSSALSLLWVPLLGHLVLLAFLFFILRNHVRVFLAFFLSLLLVLASPALNGVTLSPPRQWCITVLFLSFWLFDRAALFSRLNYFLGAFFALISLYLDYYAGQFLPGLLAFGTLCTYDRLPSIVERRERVSSLLWGLGLGIIGVLFTRLFADGGGATASFSLKVIPRNLGLLFSQCGPLMLGTKIFVRGKELYPTELSVPMVFRLLQVLAACLFVLALVKSVRLIFLRGTQWEIRRIGFLGFLVSTCSLLGFTGSQMVSDIHSARYLAPIIWMAPFTLVPLASRISVVRLLVFLTPFLISISISGWLGYSPGVRGLLPVAEPRGEAIEEKEVAHFLKDRGIHHAVAQYWLAYRLSFIYNEDPIVVPEDPGANRYAPHWEKVEKASRYAAILHPSEPRLLPEVMEKRLSERGYSFERHSVRGFTVYIVDRF